MDLNTKNTWCPGCGNFAIEKAVKKVIEKIGEENTVITAGIGCHGKIIDYLNVSSFYGLHGRPVITATGIKIGNPDLNVIAFTGDGDSLNEGVSHLVHAVKRNSDITVILHENRNFALTVKQFTATSPRGFISNSSPSGNIEDPINPLALVYASGGTFIARGFSGNVYQLQDLIMQGVKHKGFSFIEVLQPCVAWFDTYDDYREKTYNLEGVPKDPLRKINEWNYENGGKIPLGVFHKEEKESFEEKMSRGDKKINTKEFLKNKA